MMRIAFEAPSWLWLTAGLVPVIWIVALAWPVGAGLARWSSVAARSVLMSGLVLAAAGPVWVTRDAAVSAVAVMDVSASISDRDLEKERQLLKALHVTARAPHELRVVRFAVSAAEVVPNTATAAATAAEAASATRARSGAFETADEIRRPSPRQDGLGTDIAGALGLAIGLANPAATRRLLLVSDGQATAGDALAQATRLARLGIRMDTVALGNHPDEIPRADVAVLGLATSGEVQPHVTFPLLIRIASTVAGRVQVRLTRNGAALDPAGESRVISMAAGEASVAWDGRVDDDTPVSVFAVEVHLLDEIDAHPENDRAVLEIARPARPRALVLTGSPGDARALEAALRAQSIEVQTVAAGGSRATIDAVLKPAALAEVALVVLCDLARQAVDEADLEAIEAYVRAGGGLLVTGGPHAFGPGGWEGSRLESVLPLRLGVPQQSNEPSLALVLILDRSGSMSGPKMELTKQAAQGTAELLPIEDQIAVVAFDSQATAVVPLQRAANRLRIASDIGRIQPSGGTNILAGLREGLEQLGAARARKKHAILLSDGQSATEGIAELVDAAAGAHITISTISVGESADNDNGLLQMIARRGGGRHYQARDPASIPNIFTREATEVASSGLVERSTAAVVQKRARMLAGIAWSDAPHLRGYVRTWARAQAEVLLSSEGTGDPLLARWSVGLGQVAAWTSDLGTRWAGDWARWAPFSKLWGQIARATMRPRVAKRCPLSATVNDGFVDASIDCAAGATPDEDPRTGLDATLEVTAVRFDGSRVAGPPRRIPLYETAPGQYQARFPVTTGPLASEERAPERQRPGEQGAGALILKANLERDGRPVALGDGQVSIPPAPELRPRGPAGSPGSGPNERLAELAMLTGGGPLREPADLFRDAAVRDRSRSLRAPVLAAMSLMLVVDVALRRARAARRRSTKQGKAMRL